MSRWLSVLVALALLTSCTDDSSSAPDPDPDERTSTTAIVDRSGIALQPVAGETTTTIRETGTARLVGSVRGPGGLLAGATVRIERLVAGRTLRTDVVTGPDGRFLLADVPGGRYRVRAFLPPSFAQLEPEIRFLEDGEEHTFDLVVEEHHALVVRASAAPDPPVVDRPVNVVVAVAQRRVDADGVVRTSPLVGLGVELVGLGRWVLRDDSAASSSTTSTTSRFGTTTSTTAPPPDASERTDGSGQVRFELRCLATGASGLAVRIPVTQPDPPSATSAAGTRIETIALELPACVEGSRRAGDEGGSTEPTSAEDG